MSIVSWYFPFYIILFFGAYFIAPKKYRWCIVLATSILFYAWRNLTGFVIALLTALFTYLIALAMNRNQENERGDRNRTLFFSSTVIIIAWWLLLKFGSRNTDLGLIVPLGISFYSLNNIAYLNNVSRKKYPAEKNFLHYFTYILYFPQITQGPFTSYPQMKKQLLEGHDFSAERFSEGCIRSLYGLTVKKLIIANQLSLIVNGVLGSYENNTGSTLFLVMILYSIQLYADFSGYMDIVNGISHVIGIEMPENFQRPYFSSSLDEFWRRWHITLGAWFREYVFFPISMNKRVQKIGKAARKRFGNKTGKLLAGDIALFFVWTATGLWHDFTLLYLIWGYLNMLVIIASLHLDGFYKTIREKLKISDENKIYSLFRIARTFILVCLIRVPAVSKDLHMMTSIYQKILSVGNVADLFGETGPITLFLLAASVLSMLVIDVLCERKKWQDIKKNCPMLLKDIAVALMVVFFILFVGKDNDLLGGFMYARF